MQTTMCAIGHSTFLGINGVCIARHCCVLIHSSPLHSSPMELAILRSKMKLLSSTTSIVLLFGEPYVLMICKMDKYQRSTDLAISVPPQYSNIPWRPLLFGGNWLPNWISRVAMGLESTMTGSFLVPQYVGKNDSLPSTLTVFLGWHQFSYRIILDSAFGCYFTKTLWMKSNLRVQLLFVSLRITVTILKALRSTKAMASSLLEYYRIYSGRRSRRGSYPLRFSASANITSQRVEAMPKTTPSQMYMFENVD